MAEIRKGWAWFEKHQSQNTKNQGQSDLPNTEQELRKAYARCFSGPVGEKILKHLHTITLDRAFGPETSTDILRHVEGQRQLVAYINAQCKRGRLGD